MRYVAVVVALLLAGCGGDGTEPEPEPPTLAERLAGAYALVEVDGRPLPARIRDGWTCGFAPNLHYLEQYVVGDSIGLRADSTFEIRIVYDITCGESEGTGLLEFPGRFDPSPSGAMDMVLQTNGGQRLVDAQWSSTGLQATITFGEEAYRLRFAKR